MTNYAERYAAMKKLIEGIYAAPTTECAKPAIAQANEELLILSREWKAARPNRCDKCKGQGSFPENDPDVGLNGREPCEACYALGVCPHCAFNHGEESPFVEQEVPCNECGFDHLKRIEDNDPLFLLEMLMCNHCEIEEERLLDELRDLSVTIYEESDRFNHDPYYDRY